MKPTNYSSSCVFLLISLLLVSCGGGKSSEGNYKLVKHPPFKVSDAFYQNWVAGVKEGGSGINLHVTFESFTEDVVIEEFYFRYKVVQVQPSPQYRQQYVGYFKNSDKPDVIMDIDPLKEAGNTPPAEFPFQLKPDEAVIGYLQDDTMRYTKVVNLRKEEMLAYPSTAPKGEN